MRYSYTFLESIYDEVLKHFRNGDGREMAGYIFAGLSQSERETRFIGREFKPVDTSDVLSSSPHHISILSRSYCRALQYADETGQCFWFVHSHPLGFPAFSPKDDQEEPRLFKTAYTRIQGGRFHGSLVFPQGGLPFGRVWKSDLTCTDLDRIRVIGSAFRFFDQNTIAKPIPEFFDRQVRAFGPDIQRLLQSLHVAVVGAGGTGSAVCEQLIRLGIGELTVFDPQTFEPSNVNRVYGSGVSDTGTPKVALVKRLADRVGVDTVVHVVPDSIYKQEVAKRLRDADIVFACTDDDAGRGILGQLALRYAIPVIDVGVLIDSKMRVLRSVTGRVTVLLPGASCLFCRGRIDADRVRHDMTRFFNPSEAAAREKEGYAPELEENNPAIIPFTTAVACGAVSELLHRLTGFLGPGRGTTELLYRFTDEEIGHNSQPPLAGCTCANKKILGSGDAKLFLGLV